MILHIHNHVGMCRVIFTTKVTHRRIRAGGLIEQFQDGHRYEAQAGRWPIRRCVWSHLEEIQRHNCCQNSSGKFYCGPRHDHMTSPFIQWLTFVTCQTNLGHFSPSFFPSCVLVTVTAAAKLLCYRQRKIVKLWVICLARTNPVKTVIFDHKFQIQEQFGVFSEIQRILTPFILV